MTTGQSAFPSRRRFISIVAGGVALAADGRHAAAREQAYRWRGRALGAEAEIILHHSARGRARELVSAAVAEIERLEKQFSLYRPESALVQLNSAGCLNHPSHDMLKLLGHCHQFGVLTSGAFDVSIQPLWKLYADHFRSPNADPSGPGGDAIRQALRAVDFRAIDFHLGAVVLNKPGMALTFNGIAQGYITDSVADIFRAAGVANVLVNLGEFQALGFNQQAQRPWRVGVSGGALPAFRLADRALATSAPRGTLLDQLGNHLHLIDPETGKSAEHVQSVSVTAPTAVAADALSTAISVISPDRWRELVSAVDRAEAVIHGMNGNVIHFQA